MYSYRFVVGVIALSNGLAILCGLYTPEHHDTVVRTYTIGRAQT